MSLKVHVNVYDKCFNSYWSICIYIYNVIAYTNYIYIYTYIYIYIYNYGVLYLCSTNSDALL